MGLDELGDVRPLTLRRLPLGLLGELGPLVHGAIARALQELVPLLQHLGLPLRHLGLRTRQLGLKEHSHVRIVGHLVRVRVRVRWRWRRQGGGVGVEGVRVRAGAARLG